VLIKSDSIVELLERIEQRLTPPSAAPRCRSIGHQKNLLIAAHFHGAGVFDDRM
jgi:hypothetical protein